MEEIKKYDINSSVNKENGLLYGEINGHKIYQFNNENGYSYFVAVPTEYTDTYQMFIGFPNKDLKGKPRSEILDEVSEIKKMINAVNKNSIYILPDIPVEELEEANKNQDYKKYDEILNNRIRPMIEETYNIMKNYNNMKKSIDQVIYFVKKTEHDTKFIEWLEMNMPNFVYGITYDELKRFYYETLAREERDNAPDNLEAPKKEEIFNSTSKANLNEEEFIYNNAEHKSNAKKRVLTNPNAGFTNMVLTTISISIITGLSILIANLLLK